MHDMMNKKPMESQEESTPFDAVISTLKSYIKNPEAVTRETLSNLLVQMEDLKGVVDGEEVPESEEPEPQESGPSLMIAIGKKKKGEDY